MKFGFYLASQSEHYTSCMKGGQECPSRGFYFELSLSLCPVSFPLVYTQTECINIKKIKINRVKFALNHASLNIFHLGYQY